MKTPQDGPVGSPALRASAMPGPGFAAPPPRPRYRIFAGDHPSKRIDAGRRAMEGKEAPLAGRGVHARSTANVIAANLMLRASDTRTQQQFVSRLAQSHERNQAAKRCSAGMAQRHPLDPVKAKARTGRSHTLECRATPQQSARALDGNCQGADGHVLPMCSNFQHVDSVRKNVALLSIECRDLKGPFVDAILASKCAVYAGQHDDAANVRHFKWALVGETEAVFKSTSPHYEQTFEIEYDTSSPKLLKFDVYVQANKVQEEAFEKTSAAGEAERFDLCGTYVCNISDLIKAKSWSASGSLKKIRSRDAHLQFAVTRHLQQFTPSKVMEIFRSVDFNQSNCLDMIEFRNAMRIMAKLTKQPMTRELEDVAWQLANSDGDDVLQYAEFVSIVFGSQGDISVMIEDRGQRDVGLHANILFAKYRRSLNRRMGKEAFVVEEGQEFDADAHERSRHEMTRQKALQMIEKMKNSMPVASQRPPHNDVPRRDVVQRTTMWYGHKSEILNDGCPPPDSMHWDRRAKAVGMLLANLDGTETATCHLLNEDVGPCSVRTAQPLSKTVVTYFELRILRDPDVPHGAGLDGKYAIGLTTHRFSKFVGSWTPQMDADCYALVCKKPVKYEAAWSHRHKADSIHVLGNANNIATYEDTRTLFEGISEKRRAGNNATCNVRGLRPLPRGRCFFEVKFTALGKSRGDSLGGNLHVGLCSEAMSSESWTGNWTSDQDSRRHMAWTLSDNWNGQLSTSVLGMDASDAGTQQQMNQKLRKKFDSFDKDNSGKLDWNELHLALKSAGICATDDEVVEMFTALGLTREDNIPFEEFVAIIRSKAGTGTLFYAGQKIDWVFNSFFGVGDTIGLLVDTLTGVAYVFKNGVELGKAFENLPADVFPFVSMPRPGVSASITSVQAKSVDSRSDIFEGGTRRTWIDGSYFGAADRVGFLVNPFKKTCEIFKNGEHLGKAFEGLPSDVFPFVTLCHTGAQACLSFPSQPNPLIYARMKAALKKSKFVVAGDLSCSAGLLDLSDAGSSCAICLQLQAGSEHHSGDRRFEIAACDMENIFDCDLLGGQRRARLVSPIVEVTQTSGPDLVEGTRAVLTIPHCCARQGKLLFVFMPSHNISSEHRNVWTEVGASWSGRKGTGSFHADGIYCIVCLDDPSENPDLVRIEYRLLDPISGESTTTRASTVVTLDHLEGASEPKFASIQLGSCLEGVVVIHPVSAVEFAHSSKHSDRELVQAELTRGSLFEPITAIGRDDKGLHDGEEFSDSTCFAASGCSLWLQSLYARHDTLHLVDTDDGDFQLQWRGSKIELRFAIKSARVEEQSCLAQAVLSRRMAWNSALEDYHWDQFRYVFDPSSGTLFQAPNRTQLHDSCDSLLAQRCEHVAQIPRARFRAGNAPESILRYSISINDVESEESVEIATDLKQDRDAILNSMRCCAARHEARTAIQQIHVVMRLAAKVMQGNRKDDRRISEITFSPVTLCITDSRIKHKLQS